jgi:hypothetical protein
MAHRVAPTPPDADNLSGSFMLAACSDWRGGARRFHVGTGHFEPTHDAGYTTAGSLALPELSINPLLLGGSPYTRGRPSSRARNNKIGGEEQAKEPDRGRQRERKHSTVGGWQIGWRKRGDVTLMLHGSNQDSDSADKHEEHAQRCRGSKLAMARHGLRLPRQQTQEESKASHDETNGHYRETGSQPREESPLCGKEDARVGLAHRVWGRGLMNEPNRPRADGARAVRLSDGMDSP